ncbi:hypothetical protein A2U01_0077931, partial [Trifolium medium]|nr:hypothetical protein [Trifolium medium]
MSVTKNQRGVVDTLPSSDLPPSGPPAKALPKARPPDPSELPRDPPKPPDPLSPELRPSKSRDFDQLATTLPRREPQP